MNALYQINGKAKTKLKTMGKQADGMYPEPADRPMDELGDGTELQSTCEPLSEPFPCPNTVFRFV